MPAFDSYSKELGTKNYIDTMITYTDELGSFLRNLKYSRDYYVAYFI